MAKAGIINISNSKMVQKRNALFRVEENVLFWEIIGGTYHISL